MNKQAYFKLMGLEAMLKKASEEDMEQKDKKAKKKKKTAPVESSRSQTGKWRSESLGSFTAPALATTAGAVLGSLGGEGGASAGAGAGLGLSLLAALIGKLSGSISGPRTMQDQLAYNSSSGSTWLNYLLPGAAQYNKTVTQATKDQQDALLQELLAKQRLA